MEKTLKEKDHEMKLLKEKIAEFQNNENIRFLGKISQYFTYGTPIISEIPGIILDVLTKTFHHNTEKKDEENEH